MVFGINMKLQLDNIENQVKTMAVVAKSVCTQDLVRKDSLLPSESKRERIYEKSRKVDFGRELHRNVGIVPLIGT